MSDPHLGKLATYLDSISKKKKKQVRDKTNGKGPLGTISSNTVYRMR